MTKRLYMDVETVPNEKFRKPAKKRDDFPIKDFLKPVPSNIKDPEKIKARELVNQEEAETKAEQAYFENQIKEEEDFKKYSLYCWKSQAISISYAWDDDPVDCMTSEGKDEKTLLIQFFTMISKSKPTHLSFQWCGHNLKNFDLKVLQARAMFHGIVPRTFDIPWNERPWNNDIVVDTMDLIPFTKDRKTLAGIGQVLGIQTKMPGMGGEKVYDLYQTQDWQTIEAYNKFDVEAVRKICKRLGI